MKNSIVIVGVMIVLVKIDNKVPVDIILFVSVRNTIKRTFGSLWG